MLSGVNDKILNFSTKISHFKYRMFINSETFDSKFTLIASSYLK